MKNLMLIAILGTIIFFASCESNNSNTLKVLKWGPNEVTKIGAIPNKQPDGKMGIWIDVSSTEGLGEIQILFAGKPEPTAVSPKLVTCGVSPEEISIAGDKTIELKIVKTGQVIQVGNFRVVQ